MQELPSIAGAIAQKYCGGGHGGYALYLFEEASDRDAAVSQNDEMMAVEPYSRV